MNRRDFLVAGTAATLLPSCSKLPLTPSAALTPARAGPLIWEKLPTEPYRGKQDDIAFGSLTRGWFGNGQGKLYRTENGGDSWARVWEKPGTFIRALGFIDESNGVLGNVGVGSFPNVTDRTPLYFTADGGVTWTPARGIEGPTPDGICGIDVFRHQFIDRGNLAERITIHAAGRVGGPAHYLRSTDRGQTWRSSDLNALTAAIFDVKFVSEQTGFIAGSTSRSVSDARGLILRTDDGGNTWREVFRSARPFETVWKLSFPNSSTGFGSVQSYNPDPKAAQRFVAKTVDGGRTWTEVSLITDHRWRSFAIGFADDRIGWVGGMQGGLETRDGGATWAPVDMGVAVNKIRFVGTGADRRSYAIGSGVYRLKLG